MDRSTHSCWRHERPGDSCRDLSHRYPQAKVLIGTSKQLQILLIDDQGLVADETFRGEHAASLGVVS
jgi:hypothetical protein